MAAIRSQTTKQITAAQASDAIRRGRITPLFQPIECLQTGACCGFEALARLDGPDGRVAPEDFLADLNHDDRMCLFGFMLGESIALLKQGGPALADVSVSINVEISLVLDPDFVDVLRYLLARYGFSGERLCLEILEGEDIDDMPELNATLARVRQLGLAVALDDLGSGYASLAKVRDLAIDVVKLDRSFCRDLERRPAELAFVQSLLSLAHSLGKRLIVEGIETPEVYDALRIMGVEFGQGYAIAAPLPAESVIAWRARRADRAPSRRPNSLLGCYASHLMVIEACRVLRRQPLGVAWSASAKDHLNCAIGQLFGLRGWHDTKFGIAHRDFHQVLERYAEDPTAFHAYAEAFRAAMVEAILTRPSEFRCEPVPAMKPRPQAPAPKRRVKARRASQTAATA